MDLEELKARINRDDRFCRANGMRLTVIRPGYAEAELEVPPEKLNGLDLVQGGAIFTLADLAFAGAANSGGIPTVSASVSLSFLRPGTGGRLRAVASEVSRGRRTGVYSVQVFDGAGKIVAHGSITGFAFEPRPTA